MTNDISGVIRSLQTTAVNRCRERIEDAALRARGLIGTKRSDGEHEPAPEKPEYGVTSALKRRHGL